MKHLIWFGLCIVSMPLFSQNLQLHYDLRHSIDPKHNAENFPTVYFEYFKSQSDTTSFIKPGSFLFKVETDMQGDKNNIGKAYIQATQTFRLWKPKIFLGVQYSGGLGVTEPKQYSYYINNSLGIGPNYPFQWHGIYFSAAVYYTYNILKKPSNDVMLSFYWWKGFLNYKLEFAGDFELYTLNKNHGDDITKNLKGKTVSFFGEPQVWFNLNKSFAFGSKQLLYYHVTTIENIFQVYPTVAIRIKF
ncbi:MAG: hypothetical protein JWR09_2248 [Mucilaginibacter sp.]|nr:hypothetical protein [Mucilaginibacter sp.]